MAQHDVSKFQIGEVIHGKGISIRIEYICKIRKIIVAEKLSIALPFWKRGWMISSPYNQRIKFAPQTYFSNSWRSVAPQSLFVLCLRADGIKVLG